MKNDDERRRCSFNYLEFTYCSKKRRAPLLYLLSGLVLCLVRRSGVVVYLSLLLRVLFVPLEVGEMNEAECRVTDSDRHHAVKIIHIFYYLSVCLYISMYVPVYIRRREECSSKQQFG